MPEAAVVTLVIDGFCESEEKPFGPVQLYDIPPDPVRFKVEPEHCGELLADVTVGNEFIVKVPALIPVPEGVVTAIVPVVAVAAKVAVI